MQPLDSEQKHYDLLREIKPGIWIAVNSKDPRRQQYLARSIDAVIPPQDSAALHYLMYNRKQASAIKNVLSHENLVSVVHFFESQPINRNLPQQYVVTDYCDAADLGKLFYDTPYQSEQYYLPESLCWHVLRSLTRAVAWLHDGKRVCFDEATQTRQFVSTDKDWNPILHGAIEPRNIYFQHPRGSEVYGFCKLGNFKEAVVTSHTPGWNDPDELFAEDGSYCPPPMALAAKEGWEPLSDTRSKLRRQPLNQYFAANWQFRTVGTDLASIGNVVFTMMTGRQPIKACELCGVYHFTTCDTPNCAAKQAEIAGCLCILGGCEHIGDRKCSHQRIPQGTGTIRQCTEPNVDINQYLAKARYSWILRDEVKTLLSYFITNPRVTTPREAGTDAQLIEMSFREWRRLTDEGRAYRDVEDWMGDDWAFDVDEEGEPLEE